MPFNPTRYEWLVAAVKSHNSDECLIWPFSRNDHGYGQLKRSGTTRPETCHRLAFHLIHGRFPTPEGRHTCDNPLCFNPRHIVEGTHSDNMKDMSIRGRAAFGQAAANAKLSDEIVQAIRSQYIPGSASSGGRALAAAYGVSVSTISEVITRKRWKHVSPF